RHRRRSASDSDAFDSLDCSSRTPLSQIGRSRRLRAGSDPQTGEQRVQLLPHPLAILGIEVADETESLATLRLNHRDDDDSSSAGLSPEDQAAAPPPPPPPAPPRPRRRPH